MAIIIHHIHYQNLHWMDSPSARNGYPGRYPLPGYTVVEGYIVTLLPETPGTRVPVQIPDGYPGTKIPESPSTRQPVEVGELLEMN